MGLTEILISMAAVLLASQVAVVITLVVLFKKFKALKDQVNKYKIKKNRNSLPMLIVNEHTDISNRPKNEYVDGKRNSSTLVRSNSKESIVYVPTPEPERRSKNFDDNEASFWTNVESSSNDPATPNIEDVNVNAGYDEEPGEEIYGNKVIIDMVEKDKVTDSCDFDVTPDNKSSYLKVTESKSPAGSGLSVHDNSSSRRNVTKSKKSIGIDKRKGKSGDNKLRENQKVINKQEEISNKKTLSEERDSYYEGQRAEEITVQVAQEPIYENLKAKMKSRESFS